jgi:hypothetical protein
MNRRNIMGSNSNDALKAFLDEYIKRCIVVGGSILTPQDAEDLRSGKSLDSVAEAEGDAPLDKPAE